MSRVVGLASLALGIRSGARLVEIVVTNLEQVITNLTKVTTRRPEISFVKALVLSVTLIAKERSSATEWRTTSSVRVDQGRFNARRHSMDASLD